MKRTFLAAMVLGGMLAGCTSNRQTTNNNMEQELDLTQEWDKVFPLSEKVNHQKVTFMTQYGLTLAADLYTPASSDPSKERGEKLPAIAVSGPFGAVKEQCSGLYAMKMAERGFVTLAFDPSYTGESSGEPRRTASPDINTEDFMAAVDFLSKQDNVDAERIGIIGICGWGGIALNAAATDARIKATVASTMYDMTRVSGNDYNDAFDNEQWRHTQAPNFVHDYYDYYKTSRGYHKRSGNSNDGWRVIGTQAYANSRFLYYINEIRSAVLVMHGADAHSRYFGEAAYHYMVDGKAEGYKFVGEPNPNPENKQLLIIPDASHCDLYDGGYEEKAGRSATQGDACQSKKGQPKNMIPWDTLAEFFTKNME